VPEPDMAVYDQLPATPMTRDPADPSTRRTTP